MTAPATPPPGGTEYRPGLPSVEDVRAHEERGKRWHRRHRDGTYPADIVSLYIHAREGTIWEHDGGGARPAVADTLFEYRPCLPDGTPCPWPGDAPAAQQAPALTPAEQELRTEAEHGIWEDNHLMRYAKARALISEARAEAAQRVAVAVLSYFTVRPGGKCAACDSAPCASDCPVPMAREMAEGLGAWPIKPRSALSTAPLPVVQPAQQSGNLTTDATWSPLASVIARGIVASWEEHDDLWRVRYEVQGVGAVMQHLTPEDLRAIIEDCRRRMPAPAPAQPAQLTEEERRAMRQQANDWGAVAAEARGGGNGAKANVAEQNRAVLLAIIDRLAPKEQP